jgi:hypothetical protein
LYGTKITRGVSFQIILYKLVSVLDCYLVRIMLPPGGRVREQSLRLPHGDDSEFVMDVTFLVLVDNFVRYYRILKYLIFI